MGNVNEFRCGITAEELRQVWDGQLRPIPQELIPAAVSPKTRRLLAEVGLPTAGGLGNDFVFDSRLSSTVSQNGSDYLIVSEGCYWENFKIWSVLPFAVDTRTDHVVELSKDNPEDTRFFNTDLATLMLFLGQLWRVMSLDTAPEALAALADIRSALSRMDPAAIEVGAPWWRWLDDFESQCADI